jgi:hypothetical protein
MAREVRKNRLNFLLIITSIIICIALVIPPITQSEQISQFKINDEERDEFWYKIQMDEEEDFGVEAGGYFTIPTHRGEVKNASLDIHCTADTNGNHLSNPKLDIGLDGDYEWMYSGVGYGKAGQQTEFSSGRPRSIVTTAKRFGQHYDNRSIIYLPKGATVTNATMKIKGGPGRYKEDLVAGITYTGMVYYMKSKSGTFNEGAKYFLDVSPGWGYTYGLGLGDFDNDNDLDLVVGYQSSWTANIDLYLYKNKGGTGDPPWQTSRSFIGIIPATSWSYLYDYAVEDFDNDGNIDFIVSTNSGMYFFKGNGTNTFTRFQITGGGNYGKDAADFNNDGYVDFVTGSTSANIMYFQGNGDGTFDSPVSVPAGTNWGYQYMVIAGDFNDDYDQDIITKYYSSSTNIIKGKGDGTFEDPTAAGMYPTGYAAGDNYDFNYDGKQDIVCFYMTTSWPRSYYFYYYQGFGDGTFASPLYIGDSSTYTYAMAGPPKMPLGGCENLTVNIGDDGGNPEIGFTNEFDSEKTIYFGNSLNAILQSSQSRSLESFTDIYGNEMVKIPIRFDSDTYGSVMLYDLDIKYDYTAKVRTLPNYRYNLTTDLNDLLELNKNITDENRVYFGLYSETPGWAKISNLSLEYNGAPQLTKSIDKIEIDEDSNTKTIDLSSGVKKGGETLYYFTDDYDPRTSLKYGIHSVSDPEHIKLSVEDKWLRIDSTLIPDWYGTATGKVWCEDTEGIRSVSDEFQIIVNPVNDLPEPNNPLPNFQMLENETKIGFNLDDLKSAYFTDVDSEVLYYRAVLETPEENEDQLEVEVLQNNELQFNSIGSFGRYIGVVVYCHDDKEIQDWVRSELELLDCYQTFYVNITSRARTFPPQWLPLSISPIPEDVPQEGILKLKNYVTDEDDKITNLTYSIFSLTHSGYLDILINEETTELSIYPRDNFAGR